MQYHWYSHKTQARQNNATLFSFFQSNVHDKDERNCSKMGSRGKNTGQ